MAHVYVHVHAHAHAHVHVNGRVHLQVRIERRGVTPPDSVLRVASEGLVKTDDEGAEVGEAGSLFVKVLVDFPRELSEQAREWAASALP